MKIASGNASSIDRGFNYETPTCAFCWSPWKKEEQKCHGKRNLKLSSFFHRLRNMGVPFWGIGTVKITKLELFFFFKFMFKHVFQIAAVPSNLRT